MQRLKIRDPLIILGLFLSHKNIIEVIEEKSGELVYIIRMKDNKFLPGVYEEGDYTIRVVETVSGEVKEFKGLSALEKNPEVIQVAF